MAKHLGEYAFLAGVLIAVVAGIWPGAIAQTPLILAVLGLVVGFLNVEGKEAHSFLLASVALLVAGTANLSVISLWGLGATLTSILSYIALFVAPATVVLALQVVLALARD